MVYSKSDCFSDEYDAGRPDVMFVIQESWRMREILLY